MKMNKLSEKCARCLAGWKVVEHSYFKLASPLIISGLLATVLYFLQIMHKDFRAGLKTINTNVTQIAIAQKDIDNNSSKIVETRGWLRNVSLEFRRHLGRAGFGEGNE